MIEVGNLVKLKSTNKYGIVMRLVPKNTFSDIDFWEVRIGNRDCEDVIYAPEKDIQVIKERSKEIIAVEDGSVDVDKLKQDGFYVIVYRQGAKPPILLTHQHEDKGE